MLPSPTSSLERPVLTVTGAVGLLLGSLAWALTDQFAAAPLVFVASLTTALSLAVVLQNEHAATESARLRLARQLQRVRHRAGELEAALARAQVASPTPPTDALTIDAPEVARAAADLELNDLVSRAVTAVQSHADGRGVRIVTEPGELFLAVHGSPEPLERTMCSLLTQAVDGTPRGGTVCVRSRLDGDQAVAEFVPGSIASQSVGIAVGGRRTLCLPFGHQLHARPQAKRPPALTSKSTSTPSATAPRELPLAAAS